MNTMGFLAMQCQSVGLKHNNSQMDCNKMLHRHPWSPDNAFPLQRHLYVNVCGFGRNIATTFGWTCIKFLFRHSCLPREETSQSTIFLQDR